MPSPTQVRTRMRPINVTPTSSGEIVPYRRPVTGASEPQVINPVPRGQSSAPITRPAPKSSEPEIIDAEIIPSVPPASPKSTPRRPVVARDAKPSPESKTPQAYPRYPNPGDGWKSVADWAAWQNGELKSTIDEEREAYEFTQNWGKEGGVLYPWTENGPRTPIISENFDKANRYRARNGLPSIDRFGYEQPLPINPNSEPGAGFSSNPFKSPIEIPTNLPATPSNYPESPYDFSTDPETGLPFTDLQKERGREFGRPPWHINPETGTPWGSEEPGVPVPLPFDGYPGGAFRFPTPDTSVQVANWAITFEFTHSNPFARGRGRFTYYVPGPGKPIGEYRDLGPQFTALEFSNGASREIGFFINGEQVAQNGSGDGNAQGEWEDFGRSIGAPVPYEYTGTPVPGTDPTFQPLGKPAPLLQPTAKPDLTKRPQPKPTQDPRINPSPAPKLPYAPNKTLPESPNTTPVNPVSVPKSPDLTKPQIPGSPNYSPNPRPYPRVDPKGNQQPTSNPQGQPSPARPSNPAPTTTIDRPVGSSSSSSSSENDCDPCPDPCEKEELIQITFKKFKGCLLTADGKPDRFTFEKISLPKSIALSTKILLDNQAELRAAECAPCCYWDIKEGIKSNIFNGIPNVAGQQFAIARGIARVSVKYNAVQALRDNTLRNMKRITNDGSPDKSFVNAAVVYIVDNKGHAISQTHIWAVSTVIEIPLSYRDRAMVVRIMPKTVGVEFNIEDTGERWVQISK